MTGFAERGPVPTDGRCLWCGGPLRKPPGLSDVGYSGRGHFCTLGCGWHFGLWFARQGRRLTSSEPEDQADDVASAP
jgi:hypothetical protein